MEFDEETDCKKKLEEQKKSLQRQLRDIEKFASMDPVFQGQTEGDLERRAGRYSEEKDRASAGASEGAEEVTKAAKPQERSRLWRTNADDQ